MQLEAGCHRLDAILTLVRDRGGRVTASRRIIIAALLESEEHVTAERLTEVVQGVHPDIHASTIYRTLGTLAELGVVRHVHLGHGPAVYHLADEAHHHLICDVCGRVIELPTSILRPVTVRVSKEFDFELDPTHFALTGRCSTCR